MHLSLYQPFLCPAPLRCHSIYSKVWDLHMNHNQLFLTAMTANLTRIKTKIHIRDKSHQTILLLSTLLEIEQWNNFEQFATLQQPQPQGAIVHTVQTWVESNNSITGCRTFNTHHGFILSLSTAITIIFTGAHNTHLQYVNCCQIQSSSSSMSSYLCSERYWGN